jgi:ATP-dependent DNA ligase
MGDRLRSLLAPLAAAPRRTVFDAELVALSSQDGRAVQDFAAVRRATLQGDVAAARKLHLVAFDLLELAGDDVRSLPWIRRTKLLQETFPVGDRLRVVHTRPAAAPATISLSSSGLRARC